MELRIIFALIVMILFIPTHVPRKNTPRRVILPLFKMPQQTNLIFSDYDYYLVALKLSLDRCGRDCDCMVVGFPPPIKLTATI